MSNEPTIKSGSTGLSGAEEMMATADMRTLIFKYSLPTIIGMLVNSLYNTVDRIWVGKIPDVGATALTGIGLCMPIMNIIMGLAMLVGIGSAANISIYLGKKDKQTAEQILGNCLTLILVISVVFAVVCNLIAEDLLIMFGASESTLPYALPYIRVILAGTVFGMTSFALNHPIRAMGNPVMFARTQLIGGISNMILDPIFIFTFKMGITGAAVATVISQAIATALVVSYYFSDRSMLRIRPANLKLRRKTVMTIFSIGISPCIMQVMGSMIAIIANLSLKHYGNLEYGVGGGDTAIGAMTVVSSVTMLFIMPVFGINQGAQPITGYNYGAGNYERVKSSVKWAIIYAMIITGIGFVIIEIFSEQLVYMFNTDPTLIKMGARGLRIFLSMFVITGFQIPATNFFQAIGRAKISVFLSLLRQAILLIPAYLILPRFLGFAGIWVAGPLSDFFAGAITLFFLRREMKRLDMETEKMIKQPPH